MPLKQLPIPQFAGINRVIDTKDVTKMRELRNVSVRTGTIEKLKMPDVVSSNPLSTSGPRLIQYFNNSAGTDFLLLAAGSNISYANIATTPYNTITIAAPTLISSAVYTGTYRYKTAIFTDKSDNKYVFMAGNNPSKPLISIRIDTKALADVNTTTGNLLYGCSSICVNQNVLFVAVGNKIFFSEVNDGTSFRATSFERLSDPTEGINELVAYNGAVYVFSDSGVYRLFGNDVSSFSFPFIEDSGSLPNSIFCSDEEGVYFIDKDLNCRLISGGFSQTLSEGLDLYKKHVVGRTETISAPIVTKNRNYVYFCFTGYNNTTAATSYYKYIFDLESSQWTESVDNPIVYPASNKDYLGNNQAIFLGMGADSTVYNWNQIGSHTSSSIYVQSNDMDLETDNMKILRRVYLEYESSGTPTFNLYIDDAVPGCGTGASDAIPIVQGWNTLPRIYRCRYFKYRIESTSSLSSEIFNLVWEYEDLGPYAESFTGV